jgi:hypothetical protein
MDKYQVKFKEFINESVRKDLEDVLRPVPKTHKALLAGFKISFDSNHTLDNDNKHVGEIDEIKKTIRIAAPMNYGRAHTILHELAHLVWERFVDNDLRKEWAQILKNTKNKQKQEAEELFAMAYATHYAKNKISIHDHPAWHKFIEKVPS